MRRVGRKSAMERVVLVTMLTVCLVCGAANATLLTDSAGTVGLWQMDSVVSGAVPDDDSANPSRDNDLVLYGDASLVTGYENDALLLDGAGDYGYAGGWASYDTASVEVCFKPNSTAVTGTLVDAKGVFSLYMAAGGKLLWGIAGINLKNNFAVNTTDWWYASASIDTEGATSLTVKNLTTGNSVTVTGSSLLPHDFKNITVGASKDGTASFFNGKVDAVAVKTVPEPSTIALLGTSSLIFLRKRRKK